MAAIKFGFYPSSDAAEKDQSYDTENMDIAVARISNHGQLKSVGFHSTIDSICPHYLSRRFLLHALSAYL